jgi:hypothetical protein
MTLGKFDFGEWSMNELACTLAERGKMAEAIAMLELDQESYPRAPELDFMIGGSVPSARGEGQV